MIILPDFAKDAQLPIRGRPYMTSDARGREGVKSNLMISDEGERGGQAKSDVRCTY